MQLVEADLSLTAVHNLLSMSEPFGVTGSNIILTIPDVLGPTAKNLEGRLKDLEPILQKIYGQRYSVIICTPKQID